MFMFTHHWPIKLSAIEKKKIHRYKDHLKLPTARATGSNSGFTIKSTADLGQNELNWWHIKTIQSIDQSMRLLFGKGNAQNYYQFLISFQFSILLWIAFLSIEWIIWEGKYQLFLKHFYDYREMPSWKYLFRSVVIYFYINIQFKIPKTA